MTDWHRIDGSDLYRRTIAWAEGQDENTLRLTHLAWDGTPWMVNAFTGSMSEPRDREMREWCREHIGEEAWPIHGKPGPWYRGGATVYGWTHFGFATEEHMRAFVEAWPAPEGVTE